MAIAAIGCQHTQTQEFADCAAPVHEFLGRAITVEREHRGLQKLNVPLTQAFALSQIALLYYRSEWHFSLARSTLS